MQNHHYGISIKLQDNVALSSFFQTLTTSTDENNEIYVSTIQAQKYPVTGFQWHTEKNAFEWGSSNIPHSEDAIQVTKNVANFFISEARKSTNKAPAEKILDTLIYNNSPTTIVPFSIKESFPYQIYLSILNSKRYLHKS